MIIRIRSLLAKEKLTYSLSKEKVLSALSRENISSTLSKIPAKQKLLAAATTIPFLAASTMSSSCATTCPYGMVNDPFPGHCSRYMDIGGDGFCDFSQATPVTTTETSTTSSDGTTDTSTSTDGTTTTSPINEGHGNGANADITPDQSPDPNPALMPDSSNLDTGTLNGDHSNYYVLPVSMIIIGGYLFTYYLFKKGILKRNKHKRIWNLLLTAGYLGTGVTGVFLTLMINLGIRSALNSSLTFWHVEMAILMVIGTMVHIHIYWKPFKNMFKVLFGFKTRLRTNTTILGEHPSD
ncbi:MAG: hypothetical protein HVN35_00760 [Methanobacteriaceae archaeon]|nr:hypothetical protein [Methanobacteriaceae archaeon]